MPAKIATTFRTHLRLRFHDHIAVANSAKAHRIAKTAPEIITSCVSERSPQRDPTQNPKLTRNTPVLAYAIATRSYSVESFFDS